MLGAAATRGAKRQNATARCLKNMVNGCDEDSNTTLVDMDPGKKRVPKLQSFYIISSRQPGQMNS